MNYLQTRKILLSLFITIFTIGICNGQFSKKSGSRNPEKSLFGKTVGSSKKFRVKESHSVHKAREKQEKNEKRLKKEYAEFIQKSQKRTYDIQSPEVQARMKQNQKDTEIRSKEKKKSIKANTKKAGKKYS